MPLAKGRDACLLQPHSVFGFIATGQKEVGQNLRAKPEKSIEQWNKLLFFLV